MIKRLILITTALTCFFSPLTVSKASGQVLTINDGSILTINGGTLDVNCMDILVRSGGVLLLQTGTIMDKDLLAVEMGGTYTNISGTIVSCRGSSFYLIFDPNGRPTIISLPKS